MGGNINKLKIISICVTTIFMLTGCKSEDVKPKYVKTVWVKTVKGCTNVLILDYFARTGYDGNDNKFNLRMQDSYMEECKGIMNE